MIENSIQRNGFGRSILLANDGTVIAGNATYDAASSAGFDDVIVVESDGTKIIAVKRTDVEPGSKEFHNLALADNRAAELAGWDGPVIAALADDGLLDPSLFWSDDEFNRVLDGAADDFIEATGGVDESPEQWMVLVECSSEREQANVLERLSGEGLRCRALIS